MQEEKLFRKDFVFIIIINFLVFLNHLAILATFPFYIEALGGSEAVAGMRLRCSAWFRWSAVRSSGGCSITGSEK